MCVVPVEVWHKDSTEHKVVTYALLDACSTGTFIRDDLVESLELQPLEPKPSSVTTLGGTDHRPSSEITGLVVRCVPNHAKLYSAVEIQLPEAHSRPSLAVDKEEIPTPSKIDRWTYLHSLKTKIPEYDPSIPIGLMIGGDCPEALDPWEVIHSENKGPFAQRTQLGWCVVGPMGSASSRRIKSNHTRIAIPVRNVISEDIADHCFTPKEPVRESNCP